MVCRKSRIASLRSLSFSRWAHAFSGFGEGSGTSHPIPFASDSPKPMDVSRELRFLRRVISAELIAMRVSHVEKLDLPSKFLMWMKALIKASWSASSASSRFLVMRCALWTSFRARGSHSAPKASACPCFAAATKACSHIVVVSPGFLHRDDEMYLFCEQT